MFFDLSKLLWIVLSPLNALCFLALAGFALLAFRVAAGKYLVGTAMLFILVLGILPIGPLAVTWLERHYPPGQTLPGRVDGIIVLGGMFESHLSDHYGQTVMNDHSDRMLCFIDLIKKYPRAKHVFSGGSGDYLHPDTSEAVHAKRMLALTGINRGILFEGQSRNTYENVVLSKQMATPAQGENWVVITSAYHMPRTMGVFAQENWPVIPYSCDPKTDGSYEFLGQLPNAARNFRLLDIAVREIIGMIIYNATGKSAFILPLSPVTMAP